MNDPIEADETEIDIEPRSPTAIATRLLLVVSAARRAFLDADDDQSSRQQRDAERFDLANWLAAENLLAEATPDERRLIDAPLATLPPEAQADASWWGEAAIALAWTIGLADQIPPYDHPADPGPVFALVPEPWDSTAAFIRAAGARPEPDLATERERAEIWYWRAEAEATRRATANAAERAEIETAIRDVADEARTSGLLPPSAAPDFAVAGKPYSSIPEQDAESLAALAFERLAALNWACGIGEHWREDDDPL